MLKKSPGFGAYVLMSLAQNQTGRSFVDLVVDALVHAGVKRHHIITDVVDDPTKTTFDIVVLSQKRHRPVFINAKVSLRERWKIEDRDAANLREDRRNCATHIYAQVNARFGLPKGTLTRSTTDEIWVVFHRERAKASVAATINHANNIGTQLTGMDRDHFITALDAMAMNRLLAVCL